jgi:hypothetical protein
MVRRIRLKILDEAGIATRELSVDVTYFVMRVKKHLSFGGLLLSKCLPNVVQIYTRWGGMDAIELRIYVLESAEHLIEGVIFKHQKDDVFDGISG